MVPGDDLNARGRKIASLSGLEHATQVTSLDLGDNALRDLTPLTGLEHLRSLRVDRNFIDSLQPLLRNAHIRNGVEVDVSRNCLDLQAAGSADMADVMGLEAKGVRLDSSRQKNSSDCAP